MGDDGFEDFVADGGEDALVVVEAEGLGGRGLVCLWREGKEDGLSNTIGVEEWLIEATLSKDIRAYLINLRQHLDLRSMQYSQSQADHL